MHDVGGGAPGRDVDANVLRERAAAILREHASDEGRLREARDALLQVVRTGESGAPGQTHYLLGLAYFFLQDWPNAAKCFGDALRHAAGDAGLEARIRRLLARTETNEAIRAHCPTHESRDFDPAALLSPPALALREPELPEAAPIDAKRVVPGIARRVLGRIGGFVVDCGIALAYRTRMRRVLFAFESWDKRHPVIGSLELGGIRKDLNGDKLQSTYDGLVGHQPPGQTRPAWTRRVRTATGAWTTDDPMEGAAGTEIQRTGWPLSRRTNRAQDPSLPNARDVSRLVLAAEPGKPQQVAASLNLLTIAWIQAQLHDWVSHRPTPVDGHYPVPLAADDPLRQRYGIDVLQVPKSAANPIPQDGKLTFLNEVTHWWDASHLYGSDEETLARLRTRAGDGKLRMTDQSLLPIRPETGTEDSGFTRNWWIGLSLVHTLFARHHNHICDELIKACPWHGKDDLLFHTARLVNAAILAKIHTVEWTPAVLANQSVVSGMAINWWGMLQGLRKPFGQRRVSSTWEPVHPVLGGIVGGKRDNHGKPYGLSEEFTEIYRLHAGMPEEIALRRLDDARQVVARLPTDRTRGAAARGLAQTYGMDVLLNSFGHQHMPALVHNNYPAFMSEISVEGQPVVDVGTIDILRARERGVPQYNDFRRMIGLNPITRFDDLGCSAEMVRKLELLYGKDRAGVEKLDLAAGTCCELSRPEGFGFGETLFTVFIQMASRRLQADPFYTDKFNERYYTRRGMEIIESATMKGVLLLHHPNLAQTGLAGVHNAFEPWGTTAQTHPAEHPLAAIETY